MKSLLALACALASLAACGSDSAATNDESCSTSSTFPAAALTTATSDTGKLHVAVRGAPYQPLLAGLQCVELVVTDSATGSSVDGLAITMTPWMPAMGHGASVTPLLTPLGQGRYVFTNVSLSMPGEWQLRMTLSGSGAGQAGDSVDPTFNVD